MAKVYNHKSYKLVPLKEAESIDFLQKRIFEVGADCKDLSRDVATLLLRNGHDEEAGDVLKESGAQMRCLRAAIKHFSDSVGYSYVQDEPLPKVSTRGAVRHSPLQHRRKG
jgi:hypothetical protein